ncbi:hypothetical protein PS943_01463 [Pseudomonas fluorescens]|uniref:Uncharacterized protein n=1 Tax=Pseudomonas fluorescens TaxID=294 RepID=A0A5E7W4F6_PSEFL|nr:hypothetical protein PS943_01463 [Pseudomonas fluorescens]
MEGLPSSACLAGWRDSLKWGIRMSLEWIGDAKGDI